MGFSEIRLAVPFRLWFLGTGNAVSGDWRTPLSFYSRSLNSNLFLQRLSSSCQEIVQCVGGGGGEEGRDRRGHNWLPSTLSAYDLRETTPFPHCIPVSVMASCLLMFACLHQVPEPTSPQASLDAPAPWMVPWRPIRIDYQGARERKRGEWGKHLNAILSTGILPGIFFISLIITFLLSYHTLPR